MHRGTSAPHSNDDNYDPSRIPISINEVDPHEWDKAFSIAGPYAKDIKKLFYFYEDGKDFLRVN